MPKVETKRPSSREIAKARRWWAHMAGGTKFPTIPKPLKAYAAFNASGKILPGSCRWTWKVCESEMLRAGYTYGRFDITAVDIVPKKTHRRKT